MSNQTTQRDDSKQALYVALELSKKTWKLAIGDGSARPPRVTSIAAGDFGALRSHLERARKRFEVDEQGPVRCCYEAGRDGFWIHRALGAVGIDNVVVDSASIEVSRRKRQAKTDRLDALALLGLLVRHHRGERPWRVVHVPTAEQEDARQLHRELERLKGERRRHRVRIQSLLFAQGVDLSVGRDFLEQVQAVRLWNEEPLPAALRAAIEREHMRLLLVQSQIAELEQRRKELLESTRDKTLQQVQLLSQLRGIGVHSAWVFMLEFFGWRDFRNRKQVGAAAGLTPSPHQSGSSERSQGISKAGNVRIRALVIELAWGWLRHQPDSELSKWFQRRFGAGGGRMRRIGIVAMARRLLVDLWKFVEHGVVPDGARLKTA